MTKEKRLMNEIRLWCGEHDLICIRANVGKVRMKDGGWFDTGLPVGYPDLTIIGYGFIIYCECKIKPNKPTKEQIAFLAEMNKRGHGTLIAYSLDDLIEYMKEENYEFRYNA